MNVHCESTGLSSSLWRRQLGEHCSQAAAAGVQQRRGMQRHGIACRLRCQEASQLQPKRLKIVKFI